MGIAEMERGVLGVLLIKKMVENKEIIENLEEIEKDLKNLLYLIFHYHQKSCFTAISYIG